MKKTLNINLGGMIFHIDEDAFNKLEAYLAALRSQFSRTSGGDEIVNDVEVRMGELFRDRTSPSKEVINRSDVDEVIAIMGEPKDYWQEEAEPNFEQNQQSYDKKMHRDVDSRIIGGVASGLAAYFNIDSIWVRLLFVAFMFAGFGFILYIILWMVVPAARSTAEKLQMRGKPVTLSNIENFVKDESSALGASFSKLGGKAKEYGRGSSNMLGQFFGSIFQVIRMIFKFIFKVLGIFVLGIMLIFLGSIVLMLFVGIDVNEYHYSIAELSQTVQLAAIDSGSFNSILTGVTLLFLGPVVLLIFFGLRIVFGLDPLNSGVRKGLAFLSLAGLFITIVSAVHISREFNEYSSKNIEQPLVMENGMLQIDVLQDLGYSHIGNYRSFSDLDFKVVEDDIYYGNVRLNVLESKTGQSYIQTKSNARGATRDLARANARSPIHSMKIDTGRVIAGNYFTLPKNDFFRFQEININVFLAIGDSVRFGEGSENLIYDIVNEQDYWDPDMIGHTWTMTKRGLFCTDCPNSESLKQEWKKEELEETWDKENEIETNDDQEVIIEGDRIIIRNKQVYRGNENSHERLATLRLSNTAARLI
jgi:phage shock protein PspC (stress-responsive transcriptional regulator)